jgi:hypothetical protein
MPGQPKTNICARERGLNYACMKKGRNRGAFAAWSAAQRAFLMFYGGLLPSLCAAQDCRRRPCIKPDKNELGTVSYGRRYGPAEMALRNRQLWSYISELILISRRIK